ncbi:hypothetical protein DM860_016572 [Cuscuta australis]|uniref:Uncharacterized protein n=1 Tax=Cuscuta australis TaxID=267555 RepID=A0A328DQI8_9ASTE|nr:hypothetical protein DM860_016572 [Cuscuta australis]
MVLRHHSTILSSKLQIFGTLGSPTAGDSVLELILLIFYMNFEKSKGLDGEKLGRGGGRGVRGLLSIICGGTAGGGLGSEATPLQSLPLQSKAFGVAEPSAWEATRFQSRS